MKIIFPFPIFLLIDPKAIPFVQSIFSSSQILPFLQYIKQQPGMKFTIDFLSVANPLPSGTSIGSYLFQFFVRKQISLGPLAFFAGCRMALLSNRPRRQRRLQTSPLSTSRIQLGVVLQTNLLSLSANRLMLIYKCEEKTKPYYQDQRFRLPNILFLGQILLRFIRRLFLKSGIHRLELIPIYTLGQSYRDAVALRDTYRLFGLSYANDSRLRDKRLLQPGVLASISGGGCRIWLVILPPFRYESSSLCRSALFFWTLVLLTEPICGNLSNRFFCSSASLQISSLASLGNSMTILAGIRVLQIRPLALNSCFSQCLSCISNPRLGQTMGLFYFTKVMASRKVSLCFFMMQAMTMVADYELMGKYSGDACSAVHEDSSPGEAYVTGAQLPESMVPKPSLKNDAMFSLLMSATGQVMCLMPAGISRCYKPAAAVIIVFTEKCASSFSSVAELKSPSSRVPRPASAGSISLAHWY